MICLMLSTLFLLMLVNSSRSSLTPLSFKLCPARLCLSWKKLVLSATRLL